MSSRNKEVLKALAANKKRALESRQASIDALANAGILTKSGNFRKPYKDLCTPQKRG